MNPIFFQSEWEPCYHTQLISHYSIPVADHGFLRRGDPIQGLESKFNFFANNLFNWRINWLRGSWNSKHPRPVTRGRHFAKMPNGANPGFSVGANPLGCQPYILSPPPPKKNEKLKSRRNRPVDTALLNPQMDKYHRAHKIVKSYNIQFSGIISGGSRISQTGDTNLKEGRHQCGHLFPKTAWKWKQLNREA